VQRGGVSTGKFDSNARFKLSFVAKSASSLAMSKPTMGRGLGALMTEGKPQSDSQNQNGKTQIAAGVRTLMQGASPTSTASSARAAAPAATAAPKIVAAPVAKTLSPALNDSKGPAIPRWYFLAADALLIGLALFIAFKSPKPMPTSRMILAIVVVILAAGCGFCAMLAGTDKE
jgi:hypothetical protein